jgi:4-amino-4-deoxy-L-arabinose transferase-like glycosyltransferase
VELRGVLDIGLAHALTPGWRQPVPVLAALAALTLLRLIVAAVVPLSPDEAYYWVWSRALAPGYLDHPPMVALWIRAGTWLAGDGALGVRLLGPLSAALGSLLLADAAEQLLPGRGAGWRAAALLNATLFLGVGAVTMTPDTPLLFFWTLALWALARIAAGGGAGWFIAAGLAAGLALASKYTAAFLGLGILLWLLAVPDMRRWLARPAPWLGALAAGAVFAPVVLWNAAHGWASFAKQGGRLGDWNPARAMQFLGELTGAQIGLATPLVFLLCAGGVVLAARRVWRTRDAGWTLLAALTVPAVAVFVQHAFGDRVQGNWPAIVYPAAAIAAAGLAGPVWHRLFRPALALGLVITLIVYAQAALAPLPANLDPTARLLAGWPGFAAEVDAMAARQHADFIAADQYGIAAELARSSLAGMPVLGVERRWAAFDLPAAAIDGRRGILVRSLRRGADVDVTPWADITEIGRVNRERAGVVVEAYRIYSVLGRAGGTASVRLPRPDEK